ncbi:hypothetical protein I2I11_03965 [Pontibacter sp. 172403-2]|uniref:hypothetical protein n=1 Tax=Pontibacter rufus TaxID=2791028 RepID=UPI0018AFDF76|nr:hypothetical protein [Pontibacter sp. 172403-2]MBF9252440.1 hypothetical protein [Pontibacter sp. 172403-2]
MKKHLLSLPLLLCLFFSACTPEDDVDMPMPENPVEEQILGDWLNYEEETEWYPHEGDTSPDPDFADIYNGNPTPVQQGYRFDGHFIYKGERSLGGGAYDFPDIYTDPLSVYHIAKQDGKSYIEYSNTQWQISAITDSTMTWRRELKNTKIQEGGSEQEIYLKVDIRRFRKEN